MVTGYGAGVAKATNPKHTVQLQQTAIEAKEYYSSIIG
jgi:hypothetical protein